MDHAGDAATSLIRGYLTHPWNRGRVSVYKGDRQSCSFVLVTDAATVFRVTVEDIGWEGMTEEELQDRDDARTTLDENGYPKEHDG